MTRESHLSDLTDAEWNAVAELIPAPQQGGRKREVDLREVLNALLYLRSTSCRWRNLPETFPNRSTVRYYYDVWRSTDVWIRIENILKVSRSCETLTPDETEPD